MSTNANTVSARTVREYFKARPEKVKPDWAASLNGRGRLHPDMIKAYARATKGQRTYDPTAKVDDSRRVTLFGPKGKKFVVDTADLRAFDGSTGKRGRISKATKDAYLDTLVNA